MAKIRLPKTSPEIGISPIPRIAPTQTDPGAVLAGGLIGIGSQLVDQEKRGRAKEKSEAFSQYNQAISEATTILNDDGSLNTEASIEASEAFAVNPESSIIGVLGDENARSLLSDEDFSLTNFRLEMSRRKDKLLSSQSLSYNEEILTFSQDPNLGTWGKDVIQDAMRRQSETIARIDDSEYKANALNNAVTKQRAFNSIEQSAMSGGMQTAIEFFVDVFEGEYDFFNPNKLDLLKDANKYVSSQVAASTTISGGTNSLSVSGFNEFDFNTGKSISTIQAESLSENVEVLPPELRTLQVEITQLMKADKVSKDTASYIFGSVNVDVNAVPGVMSENDLSLAISGQFLPRIQELTGIAQQDYIQKTFLKAQQANGTIPDSLKQTAMQLATQPRTALSVIRALTQSAFITNDPKDALKINTLLTPQESYELKTLEAYIQKSGMNVDAGLQDYINRKERKGTLENLGIPLYKDEEQVVLKKHLKDHGFEDLTITADSLIDLQAFASLKYTETLINNAAIKPEDAIDLATSFAVSSFSVSGIVPMFGKLENGPSPEFFQEGNIAHLTPSEKGEYIQGAVTSALTSIDFPASIENMDEYSFIMSEEFVPEKVISEDNVAVLNRKIRVMVQIDGNLIGIDENNKYVTDPSKASKPFMFYITPEDFYEYQLPEELKELKGSNFNWAYNNYKKETKQGLNKEQILTNLKSNLKSVLFRPSMLVSDMYINNKDKHRFVKTDENGIPITDGVDKKGNVKYKRYSIYKERPSIYPSINLDPPTPSIKIQNQIIIRDALKSAVEEDFEKITTAKELLEWAGQNMLDPVGTLINSSPNRTKILNSNLIEMAP